MWKSIMVISVGGSLGSLLRWALSMNLNAHFPVMPPGTLTANLVGAYIIGVAMAFFGTNPHLAPEWRLLIMTGFCGGLTTFSTFSAEVTALLQQGRVLWALGVAAVHLCGSILLTLAGVATFMWLKGPTPQP